MQARLFITVVTFTLLSVMLVGCAEPSSTPSSAPPPGPTTPEPTPHPPPPGPVPVPPPEPSPTEPSTDVSPSSQEASTSQGSISTGDSLVQGDTIADAQLQKDVMKMIKIFEQVYARDCNEQIIANSEVTEKMKADGKWTERWTIQRCGATSSYDISYVPSDKGGTDFRVRQVKSP